MDSRMTDFERLNNLFLNNELQAISNDKLGYRYFLVKSMSRNDLCKKFLKDYSIKIPGKTSEYVLNIFNSSVSTNNIEYFILEEAKKEKITKSERDYLIDQLSRLKIFDWGGSYQNALEKNIVNNYVKKIKSYDDLNKKVDTSILEAVRGYTFNSWYNHWTTILIEDIFNDVEDIIPAIGKIEKILGIAYLNDNKIIVNKDRFPIQNLDDIPIVGDECYLIPVEECGSRTKSLRIIPPKNNNPNVHMAKNYIAKEVLNK